MAKEKVEKISFEERVAELNKQYGKGCVIGFSEKNGDDYDIISTGSIAFDNSLGIGGWAPGKLYELMGWEGTGKTTICGHAIANFQKKYPNRKVVYIDAEHALDKKYFKALGVNIDDMMISQPDYGEMGFNIAEKLIETGEVSLVVIDSDTAMKPKKEIDGEIGDSSLGIKSRLNSQAYPLLKNKLIKNNTCMIVISQFREKIGVMFGSPVTTSGGHALKFYTDVRVEVSKVLQKDDFGNKTKFKIVKNKMSPPFVEGEVFLLWGKGFDKIQEIIDLGCIHEIFKKWGNDITLLDNGSGTKDPTTKYKLEELKELLEDNEEFYNQMRTKVLDKIKQAI